MASGIASLAITIVSGCVAVNAGELLSVTCTVNGNESALPLGVPVIAPVVAFSVNPAGNDPAPATIAQVYGDVPPVAVNAAEYAAPIVPPVSEVVVMVNGSTTANV